MSLKEGHEIEEVFKFMNYLGESIAGAPFLCSAIEDLNKHIRNRPDQLGNYRIVKITVELIDG